jgi:hypothetical protein
VKENVFQSLLEVFSVIASYLMVSEDKHTTGSFEPLTAALLFNGAVKT